MTKIIINEFYRGGNLTTTDEFIEVLLTQNLTATELNSFFVGDSSSGKISKFSAYGFRNMDSIASIFKAGTIITIGGQTAVTQDTSYNPTSGDWNIALNPVGSFLLNANSSNPGDIAGEDIVWVDNSISASTISADGFAIDIGTTTGTFTNAASLDFGTSTNNTGYALNSNLVGAISTSNWLTGIGLALTTPGLPNGGTNTIYINSLRSSSVAPSVTLSSTSPTTVNGNPFAVTATFSETVTGLNENEITVTGGILVANSLTTTDGGKTYTFNVTPTTAGILTVNIAANTAQNVALNNNTAATELTRTVEYAKPILSSPMSALSYTENGDFLVIDNAIAVTDPDSANFNGGKLVVDFTTGANSNDILLIKNNPVGGVIAGVDIPGLNKIVIGGILIGTFTGGMNGTPLTVTFNSFATAARIQTLISNIVYRNISDNLISGDRTVRFQLTDNTNLTSSPVTKIISLTAANDAPIITAPGTIFNFYDGTGTPNSQGFTYQTLPYLPTATIQNGNQLTTSITDYVGYSVKSELMPILDRNIGYSIKFTAQILSENHSSAGADKNGDTIADRAGFSVTAIGNDKKGIELAFWTNEIWAQNDGVAEPIPGNLTQTLFTHGEGNKNVNTTVQTPYELEVKDNIYKLFKLDTSGARFEQILTGNLRDYTSFTTPAYLPSNPYQTPNFLFFGDGTPTASANFKLGAISVTTGSSSSLSVNEDTNLVVQGISINDVDSGTNNITVTLSVSKGNLTLNNSVTNGVTAANISNNNTKSVTLTGTQGQINTTLANTTGLIYQGNLNFNGTDTLNIGVNDGGATGGIAQIASRNLTITVNPVPDITNVTSTAVNGSYKGDDIIPITITFDQVVNVTGTPQLTLETGVNDAVANYSSGSGTNTLTFNYIVGVEQNSADLDYISIAALALNSGTITNAAGNNANLTLAAPGTTGSLGGNKSIVVDTNNIITGTSQPDRLSTSAAKDIISLGDDNDTISAEFSQLQQNDTIDGQTGSDEFILTGGSTSNLLTFNTNNPNNQISSGIPGFTIKNFEKFDFSGFLGTINFTGSARPEEVIGTAKNDTINGGEGDDIINGGAGNDILKGGNGNDIIDGGVGTDTMNGGLGDDTYIVDNSADVIEEYFGYGIDNVQASISYTLRSNVENLTLIGTNDIDGTGNELDNFLKGNSGVNTLRGFAGNDTLDGGAGIDTLLGGSGNDTYIINDNDIITENLNEGIDTVQSSITWTLGANLENLSLTGTVDINATGNTLNNIFIGNSGTNIFSGGTGNDTYYIDDSKDDIIENLNEGTDIVFASIDWTLASNIENLTLTGTAIEAKGNELNNTLMGNSSNNTIYGFAGNDILNGGAGDDTLIGGLGNDIYIVDSTKDIITEAEVLNDGTDTVESSVTWTLGNNIENLKLTGTANINGTGNDLNNLLQGNNGNNKLIGGAGSDTLIGGAGNDTMEGGTGDDTYFVDAVGDVVTEVLNEGIDIVFSSVNWTLETNIENLTLTGTTNLNGTGNELGNRLNGNSGNNILNGGLGNDIFTGGRGNDILYLGADSNLDTLIYNYGDGSDIVNEFTRGANGDLLKFNGVSAVDVVVNGSSTMFRLGDGISSNLGFGTGDILMTLSDTTGFAAGNTTKFLFA
jgi:Ca2+-binding RTX toxin-like protein